MNGLKNMHIAFDIGNVLLHYNLDVFKYEMKRQNLLSTDAEVDLFVSEAEHLSYIGATNLSKRLDSKFPTLTKENKSLIMQAWNNTISPNYQMLNFMKDLKNEHIKIALLSNMGLEHAKHIEKNYPEVFDVNVCHLSYEVGAFKPTKLFYQSFLLEHEEFLGCVYLDDLKENIIAGSKFKFNSVHFDLNKISKEQPSVFKKKLKEIKEKIILNH